MLSLATTEACQAPLSMGFTRQEYWSGLPFPSPGDLPNPGIKLNLLHCRKILYHLGHQESPNYRLLVVKSDCSLNVYLYNNNKLPSSTPWPIHLLCEYLLNIYQGLSTVLGARDWQWEKSLWCQDVYILGARMQRISNKHINVQWVCHW